jgi:hypothetical protein
MTTPNSDTTVDALKRALGARFDLISELGGGGMSRVFRARDRDLGRDVVVKLALNDRRDPSDLQRFRREIALAARVQHPNLVPVLDAGDADGVPYYLMPLVAGRSLRERLHVSGPMDVAEAVGILRDVARGLGAAHDADIVHRDVKPDNVLLSSGAAMVTDLGIAKALEPAGTTAGTTLTGTGVWVGSPDYIAPEQIFGERNIDARADWYAFGAMAFEMFTGAPPFGRSGAVAAVAGHVATLAPSLAAARPDLPRTLTSMIQQCLEKDRAARPADWHAIVASLDASVTSGAHSLGTTSTGSVAVTQGIRAWINARPAPARLYGAAALCVVAGVSWFMVARRNSGHLPGRLASEPPIERVSIAPPPAVRLDQTKVRDSVPTLAFAVATNTAGTADVAMSARIARGVDTVLDAKLKVRVDTTLVQVPDVDSASLAQAAKSTGRRLIVAIQSRTKLDSTHFVLHVVDTLGMYPAKDCVYEEVVPRTDARRAEDVMVQRIAGLLTISLDRLMRDRTMPTTVAVGRSLCNVVRLDALRVYAAARTVGLPDVRRDSLLRRAMALDVGLAPVARFDLAQLLIRAGQRNAYDSIIGALPADASPAEVARAKYQRAVSFRDYQTGVEAGRVLAESDVSGYSLHLVFALIYADRPREAIRVLDRYVAAAGALAQPQREIMVWRRMEIAWSLGDDAAVASGARWLLDSATNFQSTATQYLMRVAAVRGDSAELRALIDRYAAVQPSARIAELAALVNLANASGQPALGRWLASDAIAAAQALMDNSPAGMSTALVVARLHRSLGALDESDRIYQRVEESGDSNSVFTARIQRVRLAVERLDESTTRHLEQWMTTQLGSSRGAEISMNMARMAALRGDAEQAGVWFKRAIALGYSRFSNNIRADPDLQRLKKFPATRDLLRPPG